MYVRQASLAQEQHAIDFADIALSEDHDGQAAPPRAFICGLRMEEVMSSVIHGRNSLHSGPVSTELALNIQFSFLRLFERLKTADSVR